MQALFGSTLVVLKEGDITREVADTIVNAANSGLLGGAAYNYPRVEAVKIALGTARTWAEEYDNFDEIRFVLFSKEALEIHEQVLATLEKQQAEN